MINNYNKMDLTNINNVVGLTEPIEMPVSELLTGSYEFTIPSYQRGYRWESSEVDDNHNDVKQVDDLLNDLTTFASTSSGRYYLQPLMVKPKQTENGGYEWEVLDGQQRLTTMLLILKCLNEKLYCNKPLPLYSLKYANRLQLDFNKITFNPSLPDYDYPLLTTNLDSYFVRKAKNRIERWYNNEVADKQQLQDKMKNLLFYEDASRGGQIPPNLRAVFIWYNVEPITTTKLTGNRIHDIEVFNRLNRGKISLTNAELIKALFLLCVKESPSNSSLMSPETIVRKWDEMGKKIQNEHFWAMISPKDKKYSHRMDMLFDFIIECKGGKGGNSYRYYYNNINTQQIETLWNETKTFFDTLCKWYEDVHKYNYVGFLVDDGKKISDIYKKIEKGNNLQTQVKQCLNLMDINEIDDWSYSKDYSKIRKTLLLFNVLTCDRFGHKFPFDLFRQNAYDIEHVNSQTDNPIENIEEKIAWITEHALPCLQDDCTEKDNSGNPTQAAIEAQNLINEGEQLKVDFKTNGKDIGNKFNPYRSKVENYYACGNISQAMPDDEKDAIGNLTLLNASINREYKNALFPKKLCTLKRSDQEGAFIPVCTKYMFLKYYSNPQSNVSAFHTMRWRVDDQKAYTNAIKNLLNTIL